MCRCKMSTQSLHLFLDLVLRQIFGQLSNLTQDLTRYLSDTKIVQFSRCYYNVELSVMLQPQTLQFLLENVIPKTLLNILT